MKTLIRESIKSINSIAHMMLLAIVPAFLATTPVKAEGPAGYTYCADEGGSSKFSTPVDVAYGANGLWAYWHGTSQKIIFNNTTFAYDPVPGVPKAGYYKNYTKCADEGETVTFNTATDVAYGVDGKWLFMSGVIGTITFYPQSLGGSFPYDPAPGTRKSGYSLPVGTYNGFSDIFCINTDNTVYNKTFTPTKGWGPFENLNGGIQKLCATRNDDDHQECFCISTGGYLYHNWETGTGWSGWTHLTDNGNYIKGLQLAVGNNADGRVQLFYTDMNNSIYTIYQQTSGGWSNPVALGGAAKSLAVEQNYNGSLHLLYVGTNDFIYHNWQNSPNGQFHGEAAIGGGALKPSHLRVAQNLDGRLELFCIDNANKVWTSWQTSTASDSAWSGFYSLGGWVSKIEVAQNMDGRLEVIAIGSDNALYTTTQKTANVTSVADWTNYGTTYYRLGSYATDIAAGQTRDGYLELFSVDSGGKILHNLKNGTNGWSGFENLGGNVKQIVRAMTASEQNMRRLGPVSGAGVIQPSLTDYMTLALYVDPDSEYDPDTKLHTTGQLWATNESMHTVTYPTDVPIQITSRYVFLKLNPGKDEPLEQSTDIVTDAAFYIPKGTYAPLESFEITKFKNVAPTWKAQVNMAWDNSYRYKSVYIGLTQKTSKSNNVSNKLYYKISVKNRVIHTNPEYNP